MFGFRCHQKRLDFARAWVDLDISVLTPPKNPAPTRAVPRSPDHPAGPPRPAPRSPDPAARWKCPRTAQPEPGLLNPGPGFPCLSLWIPVASARLTRFRILGVVTSCWICPCRGLLVGLPGSGCWNRGGMDIIILSNLLRYPLSAAFPAFGFPRPVASRPIPDPRSLSRVTGYPNPATGFWQPITP